MTPDDVAAIHALVDRFYAIFTNARGLHPKVADIHELFIPEGLIVRAVGGTVETYGLESFIRPRLKILTDGTLVDFSEWETDAQTQIFGAIALRVSHYSKHGVLSGQPFDASGVKMMQFVRTGGEWKFACVSWFDVVPVEP